MCLSPAGRTGVAVLDGPVSPDEKAEYVRKMFDGIAPRYDLLNSLLSAGIHHGWRRFAVRCAALGSGGSALDICCGTGDLALALRRSVGRSGKVAGVDFSRAMLNSGSSKMVRAGIDRAQADATRLPFVDGRFDAVTVAFGVRNVGDIDAALREMARVLKPGGRLVCLEFAEPRPGAFKIVYDIYSAAVLPRIGALVSGSVQAYSYLPKSVARFKSRAELASSIRAAGFETVRYVDLTFGVVCVHVGVRDAISEPGKAR